VKETANATATKAEVCEITAGEAAESYRDAHATHRGVSELPLTEAGTSRLPDLRNLSWAGSPERGVRGPSELGATSLSLAQALTSPPDATRAFVFPGQGAQFVGMGKDLYAQFASARELYDLADGILGFPLSRLCFDGPEEELQQTRNTQPAIAVTSLALLRVALEQSPSLRRRPAFVAGHSLGEYSALVAAGALGFEEAIRLLRTRGELMQAAGEKNPGTMAAVLGLEVADCLEVCREAGAEVCNVNAPGQVVIGGRREAVVRALDYAKARGAAKVIPLSVSGAFHSSLMRPAAEGMVGPVAGVAIQDPVVPVIANCTGTPIHHDIQIRNELVDQVCRPVQWSKTVEFLAEQGVETFIEFGPGRVLSAIIKRMVRKSVCINVNDATSVVVQLGA